MVNMSFALEWDNVEDQDTKTSIFNFMDYLNSLMTAITNRNPRIMFLVAAGNESVNMCDTTEPLTFDAGNRFYNKVIAWPQFARGRDTPFYQIGATRVRPTPPLREAAAYSNFGDCIDFYTHGGAICAWNTDTSRYSAIQGTSFSTPMVAGVASVLFSQDLQQTSSSIEGRLREFASNTVTGQPSLDTTDLFVELPSTLSAPTDTAPPIKPLPDIDDIMGEASQIDTVSGNSPFYDEEKEKLPSYVWGILIGSLVVILLAALYELFKKKPGQIKR